MYLKFLVSPALPLLHAGEQGSPLDGEWSLDALLNLLHALHSFSIVVEVED